MTCGEASIDFHDHGIAIDAKKMKFQCSYCGKIESGVPRLEYHLGGIEEGVVPCEEVPENVRKIFRNMLSETKRGILHKEVGEPFHPDLPLRQKLSLNSNGVKCVKCEASQSASFQNGKSLLENGEMNHLQTHKRRVGEATAMDTYAKWDMSSKRTHKCIGRFFYESGVDFIAANCPSFKKMINGLTGNDQLKIPAIQELKGWILQDELKEMKEYVNKIRHSWARTGCSIMLDGWVDQTGRNLVNIVVECPDGPIYLHSKDVSAIVDDVDAIQVLIDEAIEEVGVDNVVQLVACTTTGWMRAVGRQFMERRRNVFWCVSASYCIELMLEKIGEIGSIREVHDKAKTITKFIYGHSKVLKLMRFHTNEHDLIKPSNMKSVAAFLTLENMVLEKNNLNAMFSSSEWSTSVWSCSLEGRIVENIVSDDSFWTAAKVALKATVPLLRVLELISNADKPQMGYIYETMDQAKEKIKVNFKNEKSQYNLFWEMIDLIWDEHLHSPLHAAGYYLNPSLLYSTDFFLDPEVAAGLLCCVVRIVQDGDTQDKISTQLDEYRKAKGAFKEGSAKGKRTNIPPAQWWSIYGKECPELQTFAIRILSQNCDGASRYGLKRGMAEKLLMRGRNNIEQQRLSDLTSLHYNLNLQNTHFGLMSDPVDGEIDQMNDWITDKSMEMAPENGDSEWMDSDCIETPMIYQGSSPYKMRKNTK